MSIRNLASRADDLIALTGFVFLVAGIFLWLGLPAALILIGLTGIYTGARIDPKQLLGRTNEQPDQATYPNE